MAWVLENFCDEKVVIVDVLLLVETGRNIRIRREARNYDVSCDFCGAAGPPGLLAPASCILCIGDWPLPVRSQGEKMLGLRVCVVGRWMRRSKCGTVGGQEVSFEKSILSRFHFPARASVNQYALCSPAASRSLASR